MKLILKPSSSECKMLLIYRVYWSPFCFVSRVTKINKSWKDLALQNCYSREPQMKSHIAACHCTPHLFPLWPRERLLPKLWLHLMLPFRKLFTNEINQTLWKFMVINSYCCCNYVLCISIIELSFYSFLLSFCFCHCPLCHLLHIASSIFLNSAY